MLKRKTTKKVAKDKIYRSVASSSAIETGESITVIEERIKAGNSKFKNLKLAS